MICTKWEMITSCFIQIQTKSIALLMVVFIFFYLTAVLHHLQSFPTRRSSDLVGQAVAARGIEQRTRARPAPVPCPRNEPGTQDRKSTRLNFSHSQISYAVFCLKKIIMGVLKILFLTTVLHRL